MVLSRSLFFDKNQNNIKILLEVSRDQSSLNNIFDDCQSFSVLNLERVFLYSKIWHKTTGKSLHYNITHEFHAAPEATEKTGEADQTVFLKLGFQNPYVLKISMELALDCAKGMLETNVCVS
jgi:hypothetical protein